MSARAPHILSYGGISPSFATPPIHAGAGSAVLGRVTVGRNAWLGALSVMRADGHFVRVGDDFHLGARSTLHINHEIFPCIVGDRVSVGRNACVHACTVGSDVVVGDEVVILDGADGGRQRRARAGRHRVPQQDGARRLRLRRQPGQAGAAAGDRRGGGAAGQDGAGAGGRVRYGSARRHRRGFAGSSVGLHRQHGGREGPADRRGGFEHLVQQQLRCRRGRDPDRARARTSRTTR